MGGGVVFLAILALSLAFSSCADNSDTDDENPSPSLPANVGENPIKETTSLSDNYKDYYLDLKADGTALYIYYNDSKNELGETVSKYKYAYDDEKKTITMILEKTYYESFVSGKGELVTYGEFCSKINEDYTVEKLRQVENEYYEERKKR